MQHQATANILYVRAALQPFARQMARAGGVVPFLGERFAFEELFVPHFFSPRPFWRARGTLPRATNSGALGRQVAALPGAVLSKHPTHAFAGIGPRVRAALAQHDHTASCFAPVALLAKDPDFSMLLLGCVEASPGFSTVHAAQSQLGLSQRHWLRHVLRWDLPGAVPPTSVAATEFPGCSRSLGKFYTLYEQDHNLVRGEIDGQAYLFVPSARAALATELAVLKRTPRFVECGRWNCLSCRFRWY